MYETLKSKRSFDVLCIENGQVKSFKFYHDSTMVQ
jgi:hypothetical protein